MSNGGNKPKSIEMPELPWAPPTRSVAFLLPNVSASYTKELLTLVRGESAIRIHSPSERSALGLANSGETPFATDNRDINDTRALSRLIEVGLLGARLVAGPDTLIEARAVSELARIDRTAERPGPYRFSRFAFIRAEPHGEWIVESPLQGFNLRVQSSAVLTLWAGTAADSIVSRDILRFSCMFGVMTRIDDDGESADGEPVELQQREFHDVLFHARSRMGLSSQTVGATYRFKDRHPSQPLIREPYSSDAIALPAPTDELKASALHQMMSSRVSRRAPGSRPPHLTELSDLLYTVFRERSHPKPPGALYENGNRSYPNAGAAYELEVYLAVAACQDLAPGLYRYSVSDHSLDAVKPLTTSSLSRLLAQAKQSSEAAAAPEVLLILASRFGRLAWKYEGLSYAATLKDVGVIYEAVALAAHAAGLGCCPLGAGNSAEFAKLTGVEHWRESSVGEILIWGPALGSSHTSGPPAR